MNCDSPFIISFIEQTRDCKAVMSCGCEYGLSMNGDDCQTCGIRFDFSGHDKDHFINAKLISAANSHYKIFEDGYNFEVECRTIITDKGEFKVIARYSHELSE